MKLCQRLFFIALTGSLLWSIPVSKVYGQEEGSPDTLYLDFSESLRLLEQENNVIKAAGFEKQHLEYERKAVKGLYLPQVTATGTFALLNDDITMGMDLTPIKETVEPLMQQLIPGLVAGGMIPPAMVPELQKIHIPNRFDLLIQDQQLGIVTGTVFWPIYAGGKIQAANKAAQARLDGAEHHLHHVSDQQITELVQRYYGLRLAKEVVAIRKDVAEGVNQHLEDARKLEKHGMISQAERLHAEVAFADADRKYKAAQKDYTLIHAGLQSTLATHNVVVPKSELFISLNHESLVYYQQLALDRNPQLKQIDAKKMLVDQKIKKERSEYLPEVALMANANLYEYQLTDLVPDYFVGVGVKLNVFDGLARERKIKAAKFQKQQVEAIHEKAKMDISTVVTKMYQEMEKAMEDYLSLEKSLEFANEYLRVRQKAFKEGFSRSVDVVDAQLNLSKVKTERMKAAYDYEVALAQLLEFCGISPEFDVYRKNNEEISNEK